MGWASAVVHQPQQHGGVPLKLSRRSHSPSRTRSLELALIRNHPRIASISLTPWSCRRSPGSRLYCSPKIDVPETVQGGQEGPGRGESESEASLSSSSVSYSTASGKESEHDKGSLIRAVIFWISAAVVFGIGLGVKEGAEKASEYFAGYILEKSLSVDNLFVFVLIFKYFKVPLPYQGRVLSYGIAGAVVFRAIMILLGAATLQSFEAVNLLLAAILIYSAYKLFTDEDEETDLSNNFIVKTCQKFIPITSYYDSDRFITVQDGIQKATPLLLTLAVVELSDVAFAIDSIPAVFGVTRDPFVVFSSNIFAILGLRSLYVLISESMGDLEYLQPAIGLVLGFIGSKMILDFFGYHVSTEVSLGVVAATIGSGMVLSFVKKSD
ncbi:integral membrane TerC family protein [Wolffia australiana]